MRSQRLPVALKLCALALVAGFLLSGGRGAHAATITVNTTNDELNVDGDCSLREAIQAANTDAAVDACTAGSGADTIELAAGTYTLSITGIEEDANQTGDLDITSDLTITGAGQGPTIINGGSDVDRVVDIVSGSASVEISSVTIRDGFLALAASGGGGIANAGMLKLTNSTVVSHAGGSFGGAIFNRPGATATITNSTIGESLAVHGGGIANAGTLTITSSTIANNHGIIVGGGIYNTGTLILKSTIVADNRLDPEATDPDCSGVITSAGHNLIEDATGCILTGDTTGNITGVDPALGPLQANGGTTETHALIEGSAAIASGSPDCPPPSTDQRGVPRFAPCDIGAFEMGGVGGIAELPAVAGKPLEGEGDAGPSASVVAGVVAAVAAGALTLGGTAWYTRRRRSS